MRVSHKQEGGLKVLKVWSVHDYNNKLLYFDGVALLGSVCRSWLHGTALAVLFASVTKFYGSAIFQLASCFCEGTMTSS